MLEHKLHVLTRKEELDVERIPGKVAIVLDVLFATSTIVTALAHGARGVVPAIDADAARASAADHRGPYVVAGELHAVTIEGFAAPTPLALVEAGVAGKTVIYSTTNGTIALHAAAPASRVYVGALLNAQALVEHVVREHRNETLLIVCAGSMGNLNVEDLYGAGCFVELLVQALGPRLDISDAARVARALYRSGPPMNVLMDGRVGTMMAARGLLHEVEHACRVSTLDVVPVLAGDVIRRAT